MRFSIQKDLLKSAMDVAILAVDKKEQDIRSTFLFDVRSEDELVLWSTDRKMMTKVPTTLVADTLQGQGKFTVEAGRLQEWIKNVKEDVIDVEVEDQTITMHCGKAKGHFASRDPAEFPDFQRQLDSPTKLFTGNPTTFSNALSFVAPFIGECTTNNKTANNMQVTELRGREMVATDSLSVSLFVVAPTEEGSDSLDAYAEMLESLGDQPADIKKRQKLTFKVGRDEIKSLIKFLNKTCTSEFTVSKNDMILVESDDGAAFGYTSSIYNLPKIGGLPKALEEPEIWKVNKANLSDAVSALAATADPEDMALTVKVTGAEGEDGVLELSMKDALDRNESTYKIPVFREKVAQEELSFIVNRDLLVSPLSLYDGDEISVGVSAHDGASVKYVKYHEVTEQNDVRVCLVILRMR